jgi:ATP citrate (pro-S)-lyase
LIPVNLKQYPSNEEIAATLLSKVPKGVHNVLVQGCGDLLVGGVLLEVDGDQELLGLSIDITDINTISRLYAVYVDCQFTYLEINPLVVIPNADATSAEVK